jgi:hypothetical protein
MAIHIATSFRVYTIILQKFLIKTSSILVLSKFGIIGKGIMFVVVGIVTIVVGSFLLRGNMHMWDKTKSEKSKEKD